MLLSIVFVTPVAVAETEYTEAEIEAYIKSFRGYCTNVEDFLDSRPINTTGNRPGSEDAVLQWGREQGLQGLNGEIRFDRRHQALNIVYRQIIKKYLPDVLVASKAPDAGVKVTVGKPYVVMFAPSGKTADRDGNIAKLGHLGPSLQAEGRWGQYMFPSVYKLRSGQLLVRVSVGGDGFPRSYLYYLSEDAGKNWRHYAYYDENSEKPACDISLMLPDGEELRCLEPYTNNRIDVTGLDLKTYGGYYRLGDLPKEMQSVPLLTRKPGMTKWTEEKAFWDPDMLVKEHEYLPMPLTMGWLTENHILKDGSLLSTVFKGLPMLSELRADGTREERAHPIMRSYDRGRSWKAVGEIPGSNFLPFWYPGTTPAGDPYPVTVRAHMLEFPNGNWVAAFRHMGIYWSGGGPLIIRKSSDQGKSWSKPKAIRVPGVNPLGLMLQNGVAVFSYNRPGVFLTFCADGKGDSWGNDVTLVKPWRHCRDENSDCNGCFLATGPDRFIYTYTKWDVPDPWGEPRQAVIAQEFIVNRKSQQVKAKKHE